MSFQPKETLVKTPKGPISIASIKEGDIVSTPTGEATVIAVDFKETTKTVVTKEVPKEEDTQGKRKARKPRGSSNSTEPETEEVIDNVNIYEVTLANSTSFLCGESQKLKVITNKWEVVTLEDVIKLYKEGTTVLVPLFYNRPDLNKSAITDIKGVDEEGSAYSITLGNDEGLYITSNYVILMDNRLMTIKPSKVSVSSNDYISLSLSMSHTYILDSAEEGSRVKIGTTIVWEGATSDAKAKIAWAKGHSKLESSLDRLLSRGTVVEIYEYVSGKWVIDRRLTI